MIDKISVVIAPKSTLIAVSSKLESSKNVTTPPQILKTKSDVV